MFSRVPVDDAVLDRAIEVQAQLAGPASGSSRSIVAAAAERAGLVLLHDDDAFEEIAAVTGQPTERASPLGATKARPVGRAFASRASRKRPRAT